LYRVELQLVMVHHLLHRYRNLVDIGDTGYSVGVDDRYTIVVVVLLGLLLVLLGLVMTLMMMMMMMRRMTMKEFVV
jgi:hypothetical protein